METKTNLLQNINKPYCIVIIVTHFNGLMFYIFLSEITPLRALSTDKTPNIKQYYFDQI